MYAVNVENTDELVADYNAALENVESLLSIVDPEETPYKSKYDARTKLDEIVNKCEATKTVATLEKNQSVVNDMSIRIASLKVKLGSISYEVEEPHNAQTDLDAALEFYFPGFLDQVNMISGELTNQESKGVEEEPFNESNLQIPALRLPSQNVFLDAMKCLNMMGILWAGRGHHRRAFMYFYAAKDFHSNATQQLTSVAPRSSTDTLAALESLYTHNLFYLAQAYGNIGNALLSCQYCAETLGRQYIQGFTSTAATLEWIKNCQGISDFYLVMGQFKDCLVALLSAQVVLASVAVEGSSSYEKEQHLDLAMDLQRRFIKLHVAVLKAAYDRVNSGASVEAAQQVSSEHPVEEMFKGIPVTLSETFDPNQVLQYEDARAIFLAASARIEICKKHFVMEGFVTDHIALVEDLSKLYLYIHVFETDIKRKIAMQTRRVDMLQPFLDIISRTAYDVQHKQISYEMGETYMSLYELKVARVKQEGKGLKKADVIKCNETNRLALASFIHFLSLYAPVSNTAFNTAAPKLFTFTVDQLLPLLDIVPDNGIVTEEELRPVLNAHFFCARVLSKVIVPPPSTPQERSRYVVASMHRYEWLSERAVAICESKAAAVQDVFGEELEICNEMVKLLPSKINRIHYLGEDVFDI